MLSAAITISGIDYENTCRHVFPIVSKKISAADSERMIVRLFRELDGVALPVLVGILQRLPEDTKDELLVRAFKSYSAVLRDKMNEELQKDRIGQCFRIGTISVEHKDGIVLDIGAIEVDYPALLKNEAVDDAIDRHLGQGLFSSVTKAVVNMASMFAPDMLEKKGVDYLEKENVRKPLKKLLGKVLCKYGIMIGIDDIAISQTHPTAEEAEEAGQPFTLTEKMENDIISALAGYLKDNVAG